MNKDHTKKYDKPRRENMIQHLLEYQFKMTGRTMMDTLNDDRWYYNWSMTSEQHAEFHKYAISVIKKVFRCNKAKAQVTYDWFDLNFGLKIDNNEK
jgi:hypothetical protein